MLQVTPWLMLLLATSLPQPVAGQEMRDTGGSELPALESPVWCAGEESFGLTLCDGVVAEKAILPLERIPDAFAAALYRKNQALIVVTHDARALYYERVGARFVLKSEETSGKDERILSVRFTRLPSLCYLFISDREIERQIGRDPPRQIYPESTKRFAFTDIAKRCDAIPLTRFDENPLGAVYVVEGLMLHLNRGKDWSRIGLPEPLGAPFRQGPSDELAQALFLFPKAIIARTQTGWALLETGTAAGRLLSTRSINAVWWEKPFEKDGDFFVVARTGPGGNTYRIDAAKGTLVQVER